MKKKLVIALLIAAALGIAGGCGKDSKNISSDTVTEGVSSDVAAEMIEYDVEDYVTLGDYKGIEVSIENTYDVTDESVKQEVETQIAAYPVYNKLDKTTVENGDLINLDYEGKVDGEAFDGGTAKGQYLEIGSGSFIEGFEEGLVGAEVGSTVELNLTFPEKNYKEDLAGKDVVFTVTVNSIEEKVDINFDTLTDEFVSENFGSESVDAYVKGVRENLETTAAENKEAAIQNAVFSVVRENATFSGLPEGLLDQRVDQYMKQFEEMCDAYGLTLEDYLSSYYQMTVEDFQTQMEDYMQFQLEAQLVLEAVAKAEKLELDEEGFRDYVNEVVSSSGLESEDALYDQYGKDYVEEQYINTEMSMKFLVDNAKVTWTEPEQTTEPADAAGENTEAPADAAGENTEAPADTEGEASAAE
ncbi:MAG: trigger factor [Eubacterium sp.]|nr:trigger factor [Eubacterium sp.]